MAAGICDPNSLEIGQTRTFTRTKRLSGGHRPYGCFGRSAACRSGDDAGDAPCGWPHVGMATGVAGPLARHRGRLSTHSADQSWPGSTRPRSTGLSDPTPAISVSPQILSDAQPAPSGSTGRGTRSGVARPKGGYRLRRLRMPGGTGSGGRSHGRGECHLTASNARRGAKRFSSARTATGPRGQKGRKVRPFASFRHAARRSFSAVPAASGSPDAGCSSCETPAQSCCAPAPSSDGASRSASHCARCAAATVPTPPRAV